MRTIGKFSFGRDKQGKLFWAYNKERLNWPHVILWRIFWQIPFLALVWAAYIIRLIQAGKYAADEFLGGI